MILAFYLLEAFSMPAKYGLLILPNRFVTNGTVA
jgi:hypothetical protein